MRTGHGLAGPAGACPAPRPAGAAAASLPLGPKEAEKQQQTAGAASTPCRLTLEAELREGHASAEQPGWEGARRGSQGPRAKRGPATGAAGQRALQAGCRGPGGLGGVQGLLGPAQPLPLPGEPAAPRATTSTLVRVDSRAAPGHWPVWSGEGELNRPRGPLTTAEGSPGPGAGRARVSWHSWGAALLFLGVSLS